MAFLEASWIAVATWGERRVPALNSGQNLHSIQRFKLIQLENFRIFSKFVEGFIIQLAYIAAEIEEIYTMYLPGTGRIARQSPKKVVVLPWATPGRHGNSVGNQ
jgi:hypothetical protein